MADREDNWTLLTLAEAGQTLNCTRSTVMGMINRGELPGLQIGAGRQWRVRKSAVEEYIVNREAEQAAKLAAISKEDGFAGDGPRIEAIFPHL